MSDYIKREDAIKEIAEKMAFEASMETGVDYMGADYIDDAKEWLSECMPADVAPVRHGRWIDSTTDLICSACETAFNDEIAWMCRDLTYGYPRYCPYCGAKMDEEE